MAQLSKSFKLNKNGIQYIVIMSKKFEELKISKFLLNALHEKGFEETTPIQEQSYPVIRSGRNMVGIAQTGTGKTFAFLLPVLNDLKYSKQINPRVLIIVPTRELVVQVVDQLEWLTEYINVRFLGVYGGANINTQKLIVAEGTDVLVSTPGRLYDLALTKALNLKDIKKLIIDEVDVMLDLGFRFQLTNIFELIPQKRQNIMFSATMTEDIDKFISDYFIEPVKISIAVSGTPLDNISQVCYTVENFYTKINLLKHILTDKETYHKVLVFAGTKKKADLIFKHLEFTFGHEMGIIHANKSQNYRIRTIRQFDSKEIRILITTDVMARGLDLDKISHVINNNTPVFAENYMHRIGRSGRAETEGNSILFSAEYELESKKSIEELMGMEIQEIPFPEEVEIATNLLPEERPTLVFEKDPDRNARKRLGGDAFHEKSDKNKKVNQGGSYRRDLAKKYKKPQRRGDKIQNNRAKKKKK